MTSVTHIHALHDYDLPPDDRDQMCAGLALVTVAGGAYFSRRVGEITLRWFHSDLHRDLTGTIETRHEGGDDWSRQVWRVGPFEFTSDHPETALTVAAAQLDAVAPRLVGWLSGETGLSDALHELASDVWTHVRCAPAFQEGVEPW